MFRPIIEAMTPYVPGEQPRPGQHLIKLNTNENPYPPSPAVGKELAQIASGDLLRLYPQPRADAFISSAARTYRMTRRSILAGNGSDELLTMLFRATLGPGDRVAYAFPTYSLYDTLAAIQEATTIRVPFGRDFVLPVAKLAAARARVTIVCNPNSPSGTFTPVTTLASLTRMVQPRLLVIDEAYVDFAASTALQLVKSHPNLVVLRTLSKSFSLAGMRLGLAFASEPVIENLLKVKDSYNLSRVAVAAGVAALSDIRWMRRNVARVIRTRELTEKHLRKLGFEVPRSSANFVLARLAGRDLGRLASALRRKGVLVRHFVTPMLRDAIRISIGTPSEMSVLFKYLTVLVPRLSGRN